MSVYAYQPYYCEENVWKFCRRAPQGEGALFAVVISNERGACPLWYQRAADSATAPIFWDYHVVAVSHSDEGSRVWDFDSRLSTPVDFETWWNRTFPGLAVLSEEFLPKFRVVPAAEFLEVFSSDRSHMQKSDGSFIHAPPEWEPIFDASRGMNLGRFVDMEDEFCGELLEAEQFRERFLS